MAIDRHYFLVRRLKERIHKELGDHKWNEYRTVFVQ